MAYPRCARTPRAELRRRGDRFAGLAARHARGVPRAVPRGRAHPVDGPGGRDTRFRCGVLVDGPDKWSLHPRHRERVTGAIALRRVRDADGTLSPGHAVGTTCCRSPSSVAYRSVGTPVGRRRLSARRCPCQNYAPRRSVPQRRASRSPRRRLAAQSSATSPPPRLRGGSGMIACTSQCLPQLRRPAPPRRHRPGVAAGAHWRCS